MARTVTAEEFEELYRATARDLIVYLRRRGSSDAENDAAEVYAIAWRRRADLPAPMFRRAWLFGAAAKVLQGARRRSANESAAVSEVGNAAEHVLTDADTSGTAAAVAAAMGRLAPAEREILRLVEWERLTAAELAVALGVRPGTARVRLHRARRALAGDPAIRALVSEPASGQSCRDLGETAAPA